MRWCHWYLLLHSNRHRSLDLADNTTNPQPSCHKILLRHPLTHDREVTAQMLRVLLLRNEIQRQTLVKRIPLQSTRVVFDWDSIFTDQKLHETEQDLCKFVLQIKAETHSICTAQMWTILYKQKRTQPFKQTNKQSSPFGPSPYWHQKNPTNPTLHIASRISQLWHIFPLVLILSTNKHILYHTLQHSLILTLEAINANRTRKVLSAARIHSTLLALWLVSSLFFRSPQRLAKTTP